MKSNQRQVIIDISNRYYNNNTSHVIGAKIIRKTKSVIKRNKVGIHLRNNRKI